MDNSKDQKAQNQQSGTVEVPDNELDQAAGGITYVFPGTVPPQIPVL